MEKHIDSKNGNGGANKLEHRTYNLPIRFPASIDAIVMLREKITAYKNAYEEAQRCSDILLSSPTSEEPKRLMDEVYRTREELFEEAT